MSDETLHNPSWDSVDIPLMSVEELRTFEGFENFTDEEAESYIRTMQQFCLLSYELFIQEKRKSNEQP